MKKPAFTIGIIFSLIGAICAYLFWITFVLVGAFANSVIKTICTIIPLINLITFAVSLFGACFCLTKPKFGGTLMIISSIISLICFAIMCISLKTLNVLIVLFWLPTVFILTAGLLATKKSN